MHAGRHFTDALKAPGINPRKLADKPPDKARRVMKGLAFIRTLYEIERRLRNKPPDERYAVRQAESQPVLERLRAWVNETRPKVAPATPLGNALGYLDAHWRGLTRFCEDGRLEIDNKPVENAIRPFVLGRRNWLFSDTVHGAKASANLYSLTETAKLNGLEPYAYLRHVFTELPEATTVEHIEALLHLPPHTRGALRRLTVNPAGELPLTMLLFGTALVYALLFGLGAFSNLLLTLVPATISNHTRKRCTS